MPTTESTPYDAVPYQCNAYYHTHPSHLRVLARIHGLDAPPAEKCRVLEIGCGSGGNLLPMAARYPHSQFMGLDLAASSILEAQAETDRAGLTNIQWAAIDLSALQPDPAGPWDYIIAHGVFSWVPEPVRMALLDLCRRLLSPHGVAFISYNAYPGGHIRQMLRDMLLYHTGEAPTPEIKIRQGRALLQMLQNGSDPSEPFGALLKQEAERASKYNPHHFYHDDLAEINQPYYIEQFGALAASSGLQYITDADHPSTCDYDLPVPLRQTLAQLESEPLRKQQYLDFISGRRFRQTLLTHAALPIQRPIPATAWDTLYFSSPHRPRDSDACLTDATSVTFIGEKEAEVRTSFPAAKRALAALGAVYPQSLSWAALQAAAGVTPEKLHQMMPEMVALRAISLTDAPAPFATTIPTHPRTPELARHQLQHSRGLTTLRHSTVRIDDDIGCWLVAQLDGTRTHEDLAHALVARLKEPPLDPEKELAEARTVIADGLQTLLNLALIERA